MKWIRRLLKTSFLKFAAVGGAGTMTNLAVFLLLADKIHWNPLAASVISFCLAVSQNYLLNASWTFLRGDSSPASPRFSVRQYFLFVSSSLVALGVNLAVLYLLLRLFVFPLKIIPQAAGILCGMILNYVFSKTIVFKPFTMGSPPQMTATVESRLEKIVQVILFVVVLVYICNWAWNVLYLLWLPYPTEYRDLATIQLSRLFSSNENPYSLVNSPPFFYLYGFIFSLLVSPLVRLAEVNLVLLHKAMTLLCVLSASFLVSLEVRKNTKSLLLQIFAFALMLTSSWNAAPFIIRPDSFGLLIALLIVFILRRNNSLPVIALCAFLTIVAFYTKQYFLFIAAPVFIYELLRDWHKALYYAAACLLLGAGSFFLVRAVFPVFFYASLVAQAGSVGGPLRHLLLQSVAFAVRAWPLFLLMCYPVARKISPPTAGHRAGTETPNRGVGGTGSESDLRIYYLLFAVAVVCLVFMGKNTGAWLSYYYQLALPSMTIIALSMLARLEHGSYRVIFLFLITVVSLFNIPLELRKQKLAFFPAVPRSYEMSWQRAYTVLDQNKSPRMLLAPIFADYICRNRLEPVDNGNTEYNIRIESGSFTMKVLRLLLPDVNAHFTRYAAWRRTVSENVREKRYSIIAVAKNYHPLVDQDDLEKYYHQIYETDLHSAGEQNWTFAFWIPDQ